MNKLEQANKVIELCHMALNGNAFNHEQPFIVRTSAKNAAWDWVAQYKASDLSAFPELPEPFISAHEDADTSWPETYSKEQMLEFAEATFKKRMG